MDGKLFTSNEDFIANVDKGMSLVNQPQLPPKAADLPNLKALMAVFVLATIKMDPEAFADEDFANKISVVSTALLSAYNLGKNSK